MTSYKEIASACTRGEVPACAAACPFKLEIRNIMSRLQRGGFDAAYRLLRDAMVFPETAVKLCSSPCEAFCERRDVDEAVGLNRLEQAVITHAKKKEPLRLNVPPKQQTVAVIGAGISGLACAQRLASRRYKVIVYEKTDRLGGSLWERFPNGSFLDDILLQFKYTDCRFCLSCPVESLDDISADAVYVATGAGGKDFRKPGNGVFIGGSITGADHAHALKQGIDAANQIESYIKTGRRPETETEESEKPVNRPDPMLLKPIGPIRPSGDGYTPEEAVAEAKRCILCDCDICLRRCPLISYFRRFPKQIAEEVEGTVHPLDVFKNRLATRMVASCDSCGICKDVCPQGVDVKSIIMDARREMVSKGDMPKVFSDFWLNDMEHAETFSVLKLPEEENMCRYLFFPGCQLGASDPRYVTETYARLLDRYPDTAILFDCCGAPAFWAGDEAAHTKKTEKLNEIWQNLKRPIPITACPTCAEMLRRFLPGCTPQSLYTLDLGDALMTGEEMTISVFDPCSSRFDHSAQEAVRGILTDAGYGMVPLLYEKEDTLCCGWGGQYMIANPTMSKSVIEDRVAQSEFTYVTYCTNCRDTFAQSGKPVFHILDILLGLNSADKEPPTLTARRENREQVKKMLIGEAPVADEGDGTVLFIEQQLAEKLSRDWILESDIKKVVSDCEKTGRKLYDIKTDCFIGHKKIGNLTYWVVYRPEEKGYRLLNAYCHRMDVLE
ncbi:MAG: NAD(P)-binding protein [Clostridiales bacterium]|nr:NAD(P)-binding protein [Clostridiales bacterium]